MRVSGPTENDAGRVNSRMHRQKEVYNVCSHLCWHSFPKCIDGVTTGRMGKDMRHGYGVCSYADGTKFRGEWEDDCWLQSTADPTFTRVHGPGLSRGIAGEPSIFVIEARDELKNK